MADDCYRLIDFGGGRKLELLSGRLIDRPSPAAENFGRMRPQQWDDAESYYDAKSKRWLHRSPWPESLQLHCGGFKMPARPTPFGHIGLFPEQAANWAWLQSPVTGSDLRALNLFAYTGASTMALVSAGFAVAHVDAAKSNVAAARQAAKINQWIDRPIRYLVDDAAKFAAREVRRARRYHTIVLDPPAYGHGPEGNAWRLQRDLWPLLEDCLRLTGDADFRILVTGHSPQVGSEDVEQFFRNTGLLPTAARNALRITSGRSQLIDDFDRPLDAGFFVRVSHGTP